MQIFFTIKELYDDGGHIILPFMPDEDEVLDQELSFEIGGNGLLLTLLILCCL